MKFVNYTVSDRIGFVTLNRPEKRNALNFEFVSELKAALSLAESDNDVKIIVLKAEGETFCAGADIDSLKKLQQFSYEENLEDSRHLKELFLQIYSLRKVVIAQVQGHALAGGCGLATICDFSFSVAEAKFGYTEVRIGFVPAIVMVFLLRKIGEAKTKQLLLSGELITAQDALSFGLVNYIVPKDTLAAAVVDFAKVLINTNSAQAMEMTKKMIADVQELPLLEALDFAAAMNARARATDDCKKGIASFLEKKPLHW